MAHGCGADAPGSPAAGSTNTSRYFAPAPGARPDTPATPDPPPPPRRQEPQPTTPVTRRFDNTATRPTPRPSQPHDPTMHEVVRRSPLLSKGELSSLWTTRGGEHRRAKATRLSRGRRRRGSAGPGVDWTQGPTTAAIAEAAGAPDPLIPGPSPHTEVTHLPAATRAPARPRTSRHTHRARQGHKCSPSPSPRTTGRL